MPHYACDMSCSNERVQETRIILLYVPMYMCVRCSVVKVITEESREPMLAVFRVSCLSLCFLYFRLIMWKNAVHIAQTCTVFILLCLFCLFLPSCMAVHVTENRKALLKAKAMLNRG